MEMQRSIAAFSSGHEHQAVIELVRAIDHIAFAFTLAPNRQYLIANDQARKLMLVGASAALEPLLRQLKEIGKEGIPWVPTNEKTSIWADQTLLDCGIITTAIRLAELERYGLARASLVAPKHILIEAASDDPERSGRLIKMLRRNIEQAAYSAESDSLASLAIAFRDRIDQYIDVDFGWYIRYESDDELKDYYRKIAELNAAGVVEGHEMPDSAEFGPLRFKQWRECCISASGRVLKHIACATRLLSLNPSLELRNLLTCFVRKDDAIRVWQEEGLSAEQAAALLRALTLDSVNVGDWRSDFDIPVPYYIDVGNDFFLLPSFGALLNPYSGATRSLQRAYSKDWDRAVDGREAIFRTQLAELLPGQRFSCTGKSHVIRRPDRSVLTDIDALLMDNRNGQVVLVQLKWNDVVGRSLRQRESRKRNLLAANKWVNSISEWINGRSSSEIARELGARFDGDRAPLIVVLTRHGWQFSGDVPYDPRATWSSWNELVLAVEEDPNSPNIFLYPHSEGLGNTQEETESSPFKWQTSRGLTLELRGL